MNGAHRVPTAAQPSKGRAAGGGRFSGKFLTPRNTSWHANSIQAKSGQTAGSSHSQAPLRHNEDFRSERDEHGRPTSKAIMAPNERTIRMSTMRPELPATPRVGGGVGFRFRWKWGFAINEGSRPAFAGAVAAENISAPGGNGWEGGVQ